MASIEDLKNYGADTEEALSRMMGNEAFYLKLIPRIFDDKNFEALEKNIKAGDLDKAFEAAHSLKGVLGNLSLTPLLEPVKEVTELLRARKDVDYSPYLKEISEKKEQLESLFR
jgi:HPt (histidine-containing phosphotransfer) domain-containing protein